MIIGITGGIGSGKSVVSKLLRMNKVPVYDSDSRAKWLTEHSDIIRTALINLLGESIYHNSCLCREKLAAYMFGNQQHVAQINAIIHPVVKADFRAWVAMQYSQEFTIVGIESAILFESGFQSEVHRVVMVYASEETRIKRAMARDNSSKEQIVKRIKSQLSDEEKAKKADYVLENEEGKALIPQVLHLITSLSQNID